MEENNIFSHISGIDAFCGERYWDPAVLNSSTVPIMSQCFNHTAMVWLPVCFTFLLAPFLSAHIFIRPRFASPHSPQQFFKIKLAWLLIADAFAMFTIAIIQSFVEGFPPAVVFVYPLALLFAMIVMCALHVACGIHSVPTSGGLYLSWLTYTICGIPELMYWFNKLFDDYSDWHWLDTPRCICYIIWFMSCLSETYVNCFADKVYPEKFPFLKNPSPELRSSFLNRITMWWFNGLCFLGFQKPLEVDDLYGLNEKDMANHLANRFENMFDAKERAMNTIVYPPGWERRQESGSFSNPPQPSDQTPLLSSTPGYGSLPSQPEKARSPSVFWTLFLLFKWDIVIAMMVKLLSDILLFCNPILLKSLIRFTEQLERPMWQGVGIAFVMFVLAELSSLLLSHYFYLMYRVGTRVQTCLTHKVYTKTLKLSSAARREKTVGEIVNLMAIDVDRFQQITPAVCQYWSNPLQIALALILLYQQIGPSVFSGVAVMLLLFPINFIITMVIRKWQTDQMFYKDERTKMVNEVLNGIKVIKLYAWEPPMEDVISDLREKELGLIRKAAFLRTFSDMLHCSSPFLVALSTFATFVYIDPSNILTPEIAFVSLTLFNQLRSPMSQVAELITQTVQVVVSNQRIKEFFCAEELNPRNVEAVAPRKGNATIIVQDANLTWESNKGKDATPFLTGLNFTITRGQLVAVVGKVGSGKSSLLHALMGEMERISGTVETVGQYAYVPQQPWVQNATLRQNVLFGKVFDDYFYGRVMDSCALIRDIQSLANSDNTEIGEKGINMSGGQRARLSLARAVYQNHDLYFLDDPMSAVDAQVGAQLFNAVIGPEGMIRHKTRILVTNELSFLEKADLILVMNEGRIEYQGKYNELKEKGAFAQLLSECEAEEEARRAEAAAKEEDDEETSEPGGIMIGGSDSDVEYDDEVMGSPILGTSYLSTVSGIINRRRISTSTVITARRRRHMSTTSRSRAPSVASQSTNTNQLCSVGRVETGRVKLETYQERGTMVNLECGTFGAFVLRTAEDKNATCVNGLPLVSPAIRMLERFNKLRSIQHPMLIQYLELSCCNIAKNTVVIVTDQYDKTLMDVLDSESFSCDDMPQLAIDIISTIGYLHDKGLTHGSLSLESIKVLNAPVASGFNPHHRKYPIRLSQYGLSYLTNNGVDVSPYETQQHFHKSPEQYIHPHSNYFSTAASDIWAYGLILLQLYKQVVLSQVQTKPQYAAMLEKLIERADWDTAYYDVLTPIQNAQDNEKLDIDEKCEDLISACLQISKYNRPTSLQVEQSLIECFSDRSDLIHSMPQDDECLLKKRPEVALFHRSTIIATLQINQLYGLWKICGASLETILIKKGVIDIQSPMVTIPVVDVDESSSFGNEQSSYFDSDSCTFKLPMDKLHEKIKSLDYAAIVRQLYPISDEHQEMNEHRRDAKSLTMTVKEKDFTYQLLRILKVQHILDAVYCEEHEFSLYNEAYIDIPPSLRAEVWRSLLGINHFKYRKINFHPEWITGDQQEITTYPEAYGGLRRILKGWLTANKNYTYWQGCDSLAAPFLLLNFEKPELALDCMDVFIHRYLKDFFVENNNESEVIQEYLRVFNQLLAYVDPELHSHLAELQCEPQLYAIPWFLTCFAHVLPMDKIFLVWDQIILHDSSFPLMVGLAIMKQFRSSLIKASFNTVIETFSQLPNLNINLLVDDSRYYHKIIPKSCTFRMHDSGFKGHDIQEDNDFMRMPASNSDELKKLSSPQLSIYEMIHKLSQRKLVVLDVRSPAEYSNGSIPGAIHVPVETINTFVSSPKHSLPDVPVCILWSSGIEMAVTASKALVSNAVKNICTLAGGYEALLSFP